MRCRTDAKTLKEKESEHSLSTQESSLSRMSRANDRLYLREIEGSFGSDKEL